LTIVEATPFVVLAPTLVRRFGGRCTTPQVRRSVVKKMLGYATMLLFAVALAGCGDKTDKSPKSVTQVKNPPTFHVCHDCGEIELDETHKCKEGVRCEKCKLIKDSAGCCKEGHLVVCKECGVAYDSETVKEHKCNITDACPHCKRQKDSPGCCVDKQAKQSTDKDQEKSPKAAS
jgi:hypothetical protein